MSDGGSGSMILGTSCSWCGAGGSVIYRLGGEEAAAALQAEEAGWTAVGPHCLCPAPECRATGEGWAAAEAAEGSGS